MLDKSQYILQFAVSIKQNNYNLFSLSHIANIKKKLKERNSFLNFSPKKLKKILFSWFLAIK